MSRVKYIKKSYIVVILVLMFSFVMVHMVQAGTAEPGTDANPLVGQDYVDSKIGELAASVDNLNKLVISLQKVQSPKFEVIELEPGKQMFLGDSTEIVLRGGKATAISGELGGLSDLTSGTGADIITGQTVPLNHLLLASRNDGRGIKITVKAWVLVKGDYSIQ